jgi:hypothetical protein
MSTLNSDITALQKLKIPRYSSNPANGNGRIYYNTTEQKLRYYSNGWIETGAASTYTDLLALNQTFATLNYDSPADWNTEITSLGYTLLATPRYGALAESLSGTTNTPPTATGQFSRTYWESNTNITRSFGFDQSALNDRPWMAIAIKDSTRYYGILYMSFDTDRPLLRNFFVNSADLKNLQVLVINPNGTTVTNTNTTRWTFSDNQQAGSTTGYQSTTRFSSDDGLWGFNLDGDANGDSPGPPLSSITGYGIQNYNAGDTSYATVYWAGTNSSSTYRAYVFTSYA